mmetsp:Transcript_5506/g.10047  ORF Transcript_5506/g.10047 Transcript_5506/m.10047 type:complete len:180 (-) Transcript_5506:283-822(-)
MDLLVFLLSTIISLVGAFSSTPTGDDGMPKYNINTQKWSPTPNAEPPYGIGRTLLGNGPMPAFTRLTKPGEYMQAVYKFQASEKCTIRYAQGNMDAYFENPNDWAYQRRVEAGLIPTEKSTYKKPYGEPIPLGQVALTVTWGIGVSGWIANLILAVTSGKFCIGDAGSTQFCQVFFPDL